MKASFLSAAVAALLAPAARGDGFEVVNLVPPPFEVVNRAAPPVAPAPAVKGCGCPLAECKCGGLCPCPVPAAMPADSTVRVHYDLGGGTGAGGSGVVVWSEGGVSLVVTNKHVVADGLAGTVTLNKTGKTYPCKFVGWSDEGDVAVLEVAATLPAATLADADAPPGTAVTHHGNTTGPQRGTLTGYAAVSVPRLGWSGTDARCDYRSDSGDSGAGVFDARGRLVAVHWGGHPGGRCAAPVGVVRRLLARVAGTRFPGLTAVVGSAPKAESPAPAGGTSAQPAASFAPGCANGRCPAPATVYRRR